MPGSSQHINGYNYMRGFWERTLEAAAIWAWGSIIHHREGRKLDIIHELLDTNRIKSHASASQDLAFPSILHGQIQVEQKVIGGVRTF